ncbi:MFS transporter TsgA [Aestuariibacter sp. GS-14]|uniref:MFS transporter TsgA n=1 Tax=Aestuariibacter sp. GS-14 TaxID=2590670 RepID=UPI0011263709|nr:MFS transporter TsgA [Aestuariibacter sp. GS-14]TPV57856.1 MFS transporter TsgA [Aestuariibacter sp. GS-14]
MMLFNQVRLTLIAFFSYMVMSGLLTQAGVILNAVATTLQLPPAVAVSMFSWLTGGVLVGTCVSMYLYTRFPLKYLLVLTYSGLLILLLVLGVIMPQSYSAVAAIFWLLGLACGCGLSGGAVIISKIYQAQRRASAFIATDCAFSAAGYLFPTLAGWLLAQHYPWQYSYLAVGGIALLILIFVLSGDCPQAHESRSPLLQGNSRNTVADNSAWLQFRSIVNVRVVCMALAVCSYLIAQTSFLTWAPSYLSVAFGLSADAAGQVVGNYWGASIFGLLLSVALVNVVPTRWLLICASMMAIGLTFSMVSSGSGEMFISLGFAFGFLTTCIYKVAISLGTQQIPNAPPMLVTLMLFSGSVGSTIAPAISGVVVAASNEQGALWLSVCCYLLMALLFIVTLVSENKKGQSGDWPLKRVT